MERMLEAVRPTPRETERYFDRFWLRLQASYLAQLYARSDIYRGESSPRWGEADEVFGELVYQYGPWEYFEAEAAREAA